MPIAIAWQIIATTSCSVIRLLTDDTILLLRQRYVLIMDDSRVLLDQSIIGISKRLLFLESDSQALAEAAFFSLPTVQGNVLMLPNTDDQESEVNLELLFNAALASPEKMMQLFHLNNE